jgi:4Fe-4S ferredoxin
MVSIDETKDRTVHKSMDVEGSQIIERWRLLDSTKKMTYDIDKCVGCSLCSVVCPERAIEIGPVPEIAQKLIEDMPAVLIDTDKCSFCFMCERVCINSVYDITDEEGNELDKSGFLKLKQMWIYDESTCEFDEKNEFCLICEKIRDRENLEKGRHYARDLKRVIDGCPTKSMIFNSPFKGKVTILKNQLHKCDPNGCKACVNICPTESFFIPQSAEEILKHGKIACNEDTCMYCGACENSCPEKIILVNRESVDLEIPEEMDKKPWKNRWIRQFENLTLTKEQLKELYELEEDIIILSNEDLEEIDQVFEKISPSIPFSKVEYELKRESNKKTAEKMDETFKKSNVRYFIQKKNIKKLRNYLKKYS